MKITVDVKGIDAVQAKLRGLSEKKIQVAAIAAVNDAAYVGHLAVRDEINRVFDRPTPFVVKGVVYRKAGRAGSSVRVAGIRTITGAPQMETLGRDQFTSVIELSGKLSGYTNKQGVSPDMVLAAQMTGGSRRYKRHETALRSAGVLPPGMFVVPGSAAALDQYGNMRASQIVQILAWFRAFGEQGYKANMNDKGRARLMRDKKRTGAKGFEYFALQKKTNGLLPGVYQKFTFGHGASVRPVMIFVRSPQYKRRFDFYGTAEKAARAELDSAFPRYLSQLLNERGL